MSTIDVLFAFFKIDENNTMYFSLDTMPPPPLVSITAHKTSTYPQRSKPTPMYAPKTPKIVAAKSHVSPLPENLPTSTYIAVVRGTAMRDKQAAVQALREFADLKRARHGLHNRTKLQHALEIKQADAEISAARKKRDQLTVAHAALIKREAASFLRAEQRAAGAAEKLKRANEVLATHRDPEPYRQAYARKRANAMAARVLADGLEAAGSDVSPGDAAFNLVAEGATAPTMAALIDLFRAKGMHAEASDLARRHRPIMPDDATTDPHHEEAVDDLARRLSLGARTAAAHLAGSIDATELFDKHTLPVEQQLTHRDIQRNPMTPLNWRNHDHLMLLLSYMPEPARTAAAARISKGVPRGTENPLYRLDVPPYGHAATFLHARDKWQASDTASRKVAEPGDDRKRHDLADKAAEGIRAQVKQLASY